MKEKDKKKDKSTLKIILIVIAVFLLLAVFQIGSCIYSLATKSAVFGTLKDSQVTDAEMYEYQAFLDMNVGSSEREADKYADIIPQEVKNLKFDNYSEASKKYFLLYSSENWSALGEEKQKLGEAYLAFGKYYEAIAAKENFTNALKVPKVSRLLLRAMIENDKTFQELKKLETVNEETVAN